MFLRITILIIVINIGSWQIVLVMGYKKSQLVILSEAKNPCEVGWRGNSIAQSKFFATP
jgi:hypothetical protein